MILSTIKNKFLLSIPLLYNEESNTGLTSKIRTNDTTTTTNTRTSNTISNINSEEDENSTSINNNDNDDNDSSYNNSYSSNTNSNDNDDDDNNINSTITTTTTPSDTSDDDDDEYMNNTNENYLTLKNIRLSKLDMYHNMESYKITIQSIQIYLNKDDIYPILFMDKLDIEKEMNSTNKITTNTLYTFINTPYSIKQPIIKLYINGKKVNSKYTLSILVDIICFLYIYMEFMVTIELNMFYKVSYYQLQYIKCFHKIEKFLDTSFNTTMMMELEFDNKLSLLEENNEMDNGTSKEDYDHDSNHINTTTTTTTTSNTTTTIKNKKNTIYYKISLSTIEKLYNKNYSEVKLYFNILPIE
jgi:hypothetical protein